MYYSLVDKNSTIRQLAYKNVSQDTLQFGVWASTPSACSILSTSSGFWYLNGFHEFLKVFTGMSSPFGCSDLAASRFSASSLLLIRSMIFFRFRDVIFSCGSTGSTLFFGMVPSAGSCWAIVIIDLNCEKMSKRTLFDRLNSLDHSLL